MFDAIYFKTNGGTKSTVSVSNEKVQANQDRVYF